MYCRQSRPSARYPSILVVAVVQDAVGRRCRLVASIAARVNSLESIGSEEFHARETLFSIDQFGVLPVENLETESPESLEDLA